MTTLTRKERWVFSIILPLCALLAGYFLILATTDGEGSSIGFRAIATLIALPIAVIATLAVNVVIALPRHETRFSSFVTGMVAPLLIFIAEYAYLWQVWKEYPSVS